MRAATWAFRMSALGLGAWIVLFVPGSPARGGSESPAPEVIARGRTLFQRSWQPHDIRAHNGDGLGPVFNETSCVACHNQWGSGGGGSIRKNVQIVTPLAAGNNSKADDPTRLARLSESLKAQTGLRNFTSTVLHKFGTNLGYEAWRSWLLSKSFEDFTLRVADRNTPSLFGAGLIDAIPDAVLEARAERTFPDFPEIRGRVSRLRDGTIGRFGWKGQTATLDDFVRTACAAELGLEAPGHHQSPDPSNTKDAPSDLDLSEDDCRALVAYVASLPAPAMIEPTQPSERKRMMLGGVLFKTIGCAACHTPTLGPVVGLYSDLLLHDLGPSNSGEGYYSAGPEGNPSPDDLAADAKSPEQKAKPRIFGALSREWRTPPLWGLRDSAPYMHDGEARDIERAIARHDGEAQATRNRYDALSGEQKIQLRKFLLTLAAPPDAEHLPDTPKRPRPSPSTRVANNSQVAPRPLLAGPRRSSQIPLSLGSSGAF